MPVVAHAGCLHLTHLSVAPSDFPTLLRKHRAQFPTTDEVERVARECVENDFKQDETADFVRRVFDWGRGQRNRDKVLKQRLDLCVALRKTHKAACRVGLPDSLECLEPIEGLGLSFSSKLLRFMFPTDGVVLDSLIRRRLGYPKNAAGCSDFLAECHELLALVRDQPYPLRVGGVWRICDIEAAIYAKLKGY